MKGRYKDLKSKLRSLPLTRPSASYVDKVLSQKPQKVETEIRRHWYRRRIWIYGPMAAAILILVIVGIVQFLPSRRPGPDATAVGPSQDDAKLISLNGRSLRIDEVPIEDLLRLHFEHESPTITQFLAAALDRLSPREILDIAAKHAGQGGTMGDLSVSSERLPGLSPALSRVIGASELVVRARVEQVTLDVSDIKAAIMEKELDAHWVEHHGARIKAEVQLHLLEGYPSLPPPDKEKLRLRPVLHTGGLDILEEEKEYLIALQQDGDIIWMLPAFRGPQGVYPIDPNNGSVSGFRNGVMPLEDAWEFIMDTYDAIHKDIEPAGKILDYWLAKLQSEKLVDCWTAVEYLNTLAPPPVAGELVMTAIERHYGAIVQTYRENKYIFRWRAAFLKDILDLLARVGDESTVERMLALCEKERAVPDGIFNDNATEPYSQQLRDTIARLAGKGQQTQTAPPAPGSGTSMRPRKEQIQDAITQYHQGKMHINKVMSIMRRLLEPTDNEFIPFLSEIITSHWETPKLIAESLPDPCFVPVLREALKKEVTGHLVGALYACGAKEESIEIALVELTKDANNKDWSSSYRDFQNRAHIIEFLGKTGDTSLLSIIEEFTRDDVIDGYRETVAGLGGRYYSLDAMQQNAVLAFAKLGGESVIQRLKELYESEDMYVRILAAVALYAQGDNTGYELLEHFINHTERSVPEIEMRWRVDMYGGRPFEDAVKYMKLPRTDALLQERSQKNPAGIP